LAACVACLAGVAGCVTPPRTLTAPQRQEIETRCVEFLKRGLTYEYNPAVRTQAVEAMQEVADETTLPWLRAAVADSHPGVRFAACVALGVRRDSVCRQAIEGRLNDTDRSVRLAAVFALHRLGDTSRSGELAERLLSDADPLVRRNAALLIGLLEEPGAAGVLARAMRDRDAGVQNHALESMAVLGVSEARDQLVFLANGGIGSQEVFAINALARLRSRELADLFRSKVANAVHLETKLAAARALGMLNLAEGAELARGIVRRGQRFPALDPDDTTADRTLRVHMLAIAALGAAGDDGDLWTLDRLMRNNADPRLQVSAARAILEIQRRRSAALPFPAAR